MVKIEWASLIILIYFTIQYETQLDRGINSFRRN